ncbi:MAG TPA: extracellular solute-binding protein [Chloroflexota bacterium]|jgi:ABC-type Fe3+ transport system substrate-binding protein
MAEQHPGRPGVAPLHRRAFLRLLGLSGGALLAACQAPGGASQPGSALGSGASGAAPAASSDALVGRPGWEAEWDALVEAAKREGYLVVSGPPTQEVRKEMPAAFKRRFGIDMEYLGGRTGDLMTRLQAERAADQYTVDAMVAGASTLYYQAYPAGMLDPLPPVLIHPEVTDPSRWLRGSLWYMDPDQQYILRLSNQASSLVTVNTQYVKAEDIRSYQDLLDPRYQGKISAHDPGVSGPGSAMAAYLLSVFGEDYVRALYQDQQPGISREDRQISDWLARGTYPITISLLSADVEALRADGFPLVTILRDGKKVPLNVSAGYGLVALVNRAPHPNAAKLFINWIAMREGNEVYNRAQVSVSTRADLDNSWAPDYIIPKPGEEYVDAYGWDWMAQARSPEHMENLKRLTGR